MTKAWRSKKQRERHSVMILEAENAYFCRRKEIASWLAVQRSIAEQKVQANFNKASATLVVRPYVRL